MSLIIKHISFEQTQCLSGHTAMYPRICLLVCSTYVTWLAVRKLISFPILSEAGLMNYEKWNNNRVVASKDLMGDTWKDQMWRAKRIFVFEHSVMTNFNCACPAIQKGQGSSFLSEGSSWLTAYMSEQRRFWWDCADAQARLNLRCSHRR